MPRPARLRPHVALLSLLALAACDTDGAASAFSATLSGAVNADLEGEAVFGPVVEEGETRFRILLLADNGTSGGVDGSIGFYFAGAERPPAGPYEVGEAGEVALSVVLLDDLGASALAGVGGTLTIAASGPDGVSGSFDVDAETVFGGGETTAQGAFTAVPE